MTGKADSAFPCHNVVIYDTLAGGPYRYRKERRTMADHDIMQEIEELKKQLQALEAAKGHAGAQASSEGAEQRPLSETGGEAGTWLRDLIKQAEDLMGGLDLQFKE